MPTNISNPASFSSVRTAFNTEGYGISTSLFAYRQGGGIVPATSGFNIIGAGTGGDPLQLSQFSGFTVPALYVPPTVSLLDHTLDAQSSLIGGQFDTTSATAGFVLKTDGIAYARFSAGNLDADNEFYIDSVLETMDGDYNIEAWLDSGTVDQVSAYVTKGAGSNLFPGSAALNTYLPLDTERVWRVFSSRTGGGFSAAQTTITVSLVETANTSNVLDTAVIGLSASAGVI